MLELKLESFNEFDPSLESTVNGFFNNKIWLHKNLPAWVRVFEQTIRTGEVVVDSGVRAPYTTVKQSGFIPMLQAISKCRKFLLDCQRDPSLLDKADTELRKHRQELDDEQNTDKTWRNIALAYAPVHIVLCLFVHGLLGAAGVASFLVAKTLFQTAEKLGYTKQIAIDYTRKLVPELKECLHLFNSWPDRSKMTDEQVKTFLKLSTGLFESVKLLTNTAQMWCPREHWYSV